MQYENVKKHILLPKPIQKYDTQAYAATKHHDETAHQLMEKPMGKQAASSAQHAQNHSLFTFSTALCILSANENHPIDNNKEFKQKRLQKFATSAELCKFAAALQNCIN